MGRVSWQGRARDKIARDALRYAGAVSGSGRCREVLRSFTMQPQGLACACCGIWTREPSLLHVGDWRNEPLEAILKRADEDLALNWLRYLGPSDMSRWLRSCDPTLPGESVDGGICDQCREIMTDPRCAALLAEKGQENATKIAIARVAVEACEGSPRRFQYGQPDVDPDVVQRCESAERCPPGGRGLAKAATKSGLDEECRPLKR